MASQQLLIDSFLASARAASPDSNPGRIAWLEERRAALSEEVEGGDWEVGSASFDGKNATSRRHLTAEQRLSAVMRAIEILQGDPDATRATGGRMLIPRFSGIPHS
jgi:hypothetical protein